METTIWSGIPPTQVQATGPLARGVGPATFVRRPLKSFSFAPTSAAISPSMFITLDRSRPIEVLARPLLASLFPSRFPGRWRHRPKCRRIRFAAPDLATPPGPSRSDQEVKTKSGLFSQCCGTSEYKKSHHRATKKVQSKPPTEMGGRGHEVKFATSQHDPGSAD